MKKAKTLPTSSYVILGLIEVCGPLTPYELKKRVDESIGYFWEFPRAQLYLDPERLVQLGLLREEREAEGRRRRTYHLTEAGREVVESWLREQTPSPVELRDTGLLKLYFGSLTDTQTLMALAEAQATMHRLRLQEYEAIVRRIMPLANMTFALATLRMGQRYEAASIAFWEDIAKQPPGIVSTGDNSSSSS
jgi:PadR family transcriptional regulator, regulatory protein AphA